MEKRNSKMFQTSRSGWQKCHLNVLRVSRCLIFEVRYLDLKTKNPKANYGGIAQLGEHLLCKQGVIGSIPIISTKGRVDTN